MTEATFLEALAACDFGPLDIEVEEREFRLDGSSAHRRVDALLTLQWGYRREAFAVEFKTSRAARDLLHAAEQIRAVAADLGRYPLLVTPYLNRSALALLREEGVSGLDLSGNGLVEIPGRWWFYQQGQKNRYPRKRSREPYSGKSALVGRVLLAERTFATVTAVQNAVHALGGSISLGQVSKVLTAMEDDLVVRKTSDAIKLLQPKKLLEALAESYDRPEPLQTLKAKADLGPALYERLRTRADKAGARIVGFEPQRYVIAPTSRTQLEVYVEPAIGRDLATAFGLEPARRFENVIVRVVDEPGVYFDPREADGFPWCPPLEVYLQLMQGGKREQEIAEDLRTHLLDPYLA